MEKKTIAGILLILTLFGCTNRYINSDYKKGILSDKRLTVFPVSTKGIVIEDSTIIDLLMKDFSVSKEKAVDILDSLLDENISKSFLSNIDNVIGTSFPVELKNELKGISKTNDIVGNLSLKDRRLLNRLGISIPSLNFISSINCSTNFGLFISGMNLDISTDIKVNGFFIGISMNRYEFEAEDVKYVLWDYDGNRVVCAGKIDVINYSQRCEQKQEFRKTGHIIDCNDKNTFWTPMLFPIGDSIARVTPFSKDAIDSLVDKEQWQKMKIIQLTNPKRDSSLIAVKMNPLYPNVKKTLSRVNSFLINREQIRFFLTIAPSGRITSASLSDSIKLDSTTKAGLNSDFDMQICDPIDNQRLYTSVTFMVDRRNGNDQISVEKIKNVELRSKAGIMRTVMKCLANIRYAYNVRLRDGMDKSGKITVKWAIDEHGKVIKCFVVSSTINDSRLETKTVNIIKGLKFERIYNPGDVTEVVYPFVFSR